MGKFPIGVGVLRLRETVRFAGRPAPLSMTSKISANRPTFGADSFAIETHLLNFHPIEPSAETEVELHFLDRLRDEIKFPSVEALKEQIGRDVRKAQKYLRRLGQSGVRS